MSSILKVSEIQDPTNGNTAVSIDSLGTLNSTSCHFTGILASSTFTVSRSTDTKVTGMTTREKDSHNAFDGTTFTVPTGKGGVYLVTATVYYDFSNAGGDGELMYTYFYVNGSEAYRTGIQMNASSAKQIAQYIAPSTGFLTLEDGDTLELYVRLTDDSASGTLRLFGSAAYGTRFGAVRIGDA